eukprot:NODE_41_length_29768_cov_0.533924.p5 type:complete len:366 gc:universal NODE_41_length_29768_cov_0.533924:10504-11601(+)
MITTLITCVLDIWSNSAYWSFHQSCPLGTMLPIWVLVAFSAYFWIGYSIMVLNIKSIVISSRMPYLLFTEQFCIFLIVLLLTFKTPCLIEVALILICFTSTLIRTSYVYEYLSDGTGIVSKLNKLIWNKDHRIKKPHTCMFAFIVVGISLILGLVYAIRNDKLFSTCEGYPWYAGSLALVLLWLFDLLYVTFICIRGLKDKIGMKVEIFGRMFSTVCYTIGSNVYKASHEIDSSLSTYIVCINLIFWGTYVPLIFLFRHFLRTRNIHLNGSQYSFQQIDYISRQFYCSENVLFLKRYDEFILCNDETLLKNLVSDFVVIGSPYQLNINQDTRDKVIKDPSQMVIIYEQVVLLINDNILPYIQLMA